MCGNSVSRSTSTSLLINHGFYLWLELIVELLSAELLCRCETSIFYREFTSQQVYVLKVHKRLHPRLRVHFREVFYDFLLKETHYVIFHMLPL
eukprot:XP_001706425.1 Hypothetical protein GL50803_104137 [Giardia lamblia ATCC 50803]